ncbi:phosphoglucomutase/phosphomannomutase family protein, partial [Candidatus Margulisiibacteriota bacterium]
ARLSIVYDSMHGSGRGYLDRILEGFGCQVEALHGERDVLFGQGSPEPADEHLGELKSKVLELSAQAGLANDGDADRFGVVDEQGVFMSADQVIPLIFDYLVSDKGYKGAVVRSVATSHLIDRIADRHKIKVYETPVGFKHITQLMIKEDIILGGEESGGLSIKGHIPEKDGLLADLLIVEMIAKRQKPLSKIWAELIKKYGGAYTKRIGLELKDGAKKQFMDKLREQTPGELAGVKVKNVNKLDGVKLVLTDGSWVLARPSGTEPIVRIYAESDKKEKLEVILEAVKNLL